MYSRIQRDAEASLFYMLGICMDKPMIKWYNKQYEFLRVYPVKGRVDLRQIPENTWIIWAAPIVMGLLAMMGVFMPPVLFLCVLLAVYYDARLGGWTQTIVMSAVLALMGIWLWGTGGICLLLVTLIPTLTACISLRQKVSFGEGLMYAFTASLFSLVAAVFVLYMTYQQDPMSLLVNMIKETIRQQGEGSALAFSTIQTQALVEAWSMGQAYNPDTYRRLVEELTALTMDDLLLRIMPTYESFIRLYAPTAMVGITMLLGGCSWIFPGFAIKRRIRKNKPVDRKIVTASLPRSFVHWSVPRGILLVCTLILAVTLFMQSISNVVVVSSINALNFAAETVLLVQGVSFAAYWLRNKKMNIGLCWIIIIIGLSLFYTFFVMLGLAEGTMQLRKMMMMRKYSAKMQELIMQYREDPRELDQHMREFMANIEALEEEEEFASTAASGSRDEKDPEEEEDTDSNHGE